MFQKILVAIDDSVQSKQVLEQALELAKTFNASLMISHHFPFQRRLSDLSRFCPVQNFARVRSSGCYSGLLSGVGSV